MKNIFNEIIIQYADFLFKNPNLKLDLLYYLNDNLLNTETFMWDLKTALKINANGKYI
jgi:hypothetical protein